MKPLSCPSCQRAFTPETNVFCCVCKVYRLHYSHLANHLNGGNNYLQCSECGCETTFSNSMDEFKRFRELGDKYKKPESY